MVGELVLCYKIVCEIVCVHVEYESVHIGEENEAK